MKVPPPYRLADPALGLIADSCLFRVSLDSPPWQGGVAEGWGGRDSYPPIATEYAWSLVNPESLRK
jgi:hypothetical protein